MSSVYVGGTIKITAAGRHPATDRLLVDNIDLSQAHIVDIGASDGSTSLELIEKLPEFASYTIADLYLTLRAVDVGRRTVFFDRTGKAVLVAGPRFAGWPSLSTGVALVYAHVVRGARVAIADASEIVLLNPEVRRVMASDPRVDARVHDVFQPWVGEKPDVIKVANLLRRLYFSDDELVRALAALRDSLPEGGHLMLVDNPRMLNTPPRAGIWRRRGGRFVEIARLGDPEIADLVERLGAVTGNLTVAVDRKVARSA
ncbi:hypothetical protein [Nocardioides terrae]|nr:hypothetical protein [Nocardioides terrae]